MYRSRYTGIVGFPHGKHDPVLFISSNLDNSILNIINTDLECAEYIINIAKDPTFQTINLFYRVINFENISSIANIVRILKSTKNVNVYFPREINDTFPDFMLNHYHKSNGYNSYDGNYIVSYNIDTDVEDMLIFDITLLINGTAKILIPERITKEKLEMATNDDSVFEIHMPYKGSMYGGLSFDQIIQLPHYRHLLKKLRVYKFSSVTEYRQMLDTYPNYIAKSGSIFTSKGEWL